MWTYNIYKNNNTNKLGMLGNRQQVCNIRNM